MPSAWQLQSSLCTHFFASQRIFTFKDGSWKLLVNVSPRFSSKLSQQVSLVLFAPAPPTLMLSLTHPWSWLYRQFTTLQSNLGMFFPPSAMGMHTCIQYLYAEIVWIRTAHLMYCIKTYQIWEAFTNSCQRRYNFLWHNVILPDVPKLQAATTEQLRAQSVSEYHSRNPHFPLRGVPLAKRIFRHALKRTQSLILPVYL